MKNISKPVRKKIVVAAFLVAILVGSGVYALALSGNGNTQKGPQNVVTSAGPATSIDYRIYDMFQEPWGEWWGPRWSFYSTDIILTDDPGMSTMLFLPSRSVATSYQGIIYAPYRYSIDAVDLTTVNISHPEFMPIVGSPTAGATVDLNIYFQYIYQTWWDDYWLPTWGGEPDFVAPDWNVRSGADGYDLGVTYSVTMNREAAQYWMGMPTSADVATWWAANEVSYENSWETWINNEGNTRLDIWCGYEWPYDINGGLWMDATEDVSGNVVLNIGHLVLGYEILMDRWLNEAQISPGLQPYWEDFTMSVQYGETTSDYQSDGVCQYSMHAVKANGTADKGAWVFEPARIDYVIRGTHPSDYRPYATLDYQSWNAGDTMFSTSVPYEQTPNWFNLTEGQTLTIELPTGTVPVYQGVGLLETDYDDLVLGDQTAFYNIMDNGTIGLGDWITGWPKATGLDLTELYDPTTRILSIQGPQNFLNFYHKPTGILYHGTPWIEFWVDHTGPTANAGTDMNDVATETPVFFDGTGSSDDVRIFNYTWTFTHQSSPVTLYGANPDFSFLALGDYTVTLTVMDSVGNVASDDMIVHVTVLIPEFPMVLVPIAATMAMIAVFKKRRK